MSLRWFCLILFIGILFEVEFTHSAPAEVGKTKEKVRPYEFGFSIEEQQHRHEKRDENGIVMGEFGFITADGIYHVTVYATDENGKFKIISMKSYPYGKMEKKVMIARLPPATKKPVVTTKAPTTIKAMKPDGSSCGGCVLPKKSKSLPADVKDTKPQDEKAVFRPLSKDLNDDNTGGKVPSTKSAPKPIGTSPEAGTAKGKGSSSSNAQKPGSQPLVPPKVTAPGTLKPNAKGISSPKTGTGASGNKESGNNIPQIDKRFGDDDEVPSKPGKLLRPLNPSTLQNKITANTDKNTNTQPSANGLVTKNKITHEVKKSGMPSKILSSDDRPEVTNLVKLPISGATATPKPSTQIGLKSKVDQNSLTNQINSLQVNSKSLKISSAIDDPQIGRTESSVTTGMNPTKSFAGFKQNTNTVVQKQSNPTQKTTEQMQKNTSYRTTSLPEYPQGISQTNFPGSLYSTTLSPNTTVRTTLVTKTKLTQNLINPFAIPVNIGKQGALNTKDIKQTITPLIKSTKEPKSFQTLSKILPENYDSIQKQTITPPTLKTTNKNTQTAQPQSTGKALTSKSLQPNTIGAKTSTTNPQSTNKQTSPKAPSTQSTGKTANTAGSVGVGVGAASKGSGGSANGVGGGGGPLYRFNYVLDYNSHREEGSVDGSKEGNYNTIDEAGIRRIIDYIANENGYQPHIKLQRLPPNEVPTGENKLKEYEFVWFNKN